MIPVKYNVRSLFVRSGTTLMTIGSIAFVVLVYVGVLALAGGLRVAFTAAGDPNTVLVVRDGARSEMESGFATETQRILATMPGVAHDAAGDPIASGETIHVQIVERDDGTEANVSVRGVTAAAFSLRPWVQINEGRGFEPGKAELIVGSRLAERYSRLQPGRTIQLGRQAFTVVGVFDCEGASYDSEIWGDVNDLGNAYRRQNYYSSVRLKVADRADVPALIDRIESEQRLRIEAMPEPEYYRRMTDASSALFLVLGNALAVLMGIGACFAAANTMYAQVAARHREIGTLRAIGFRRRSILTAFLIEAVVLGAIAGAVGAVISLPLNGFTAQTMNNLSFTEITFALRTTPQVLLGGVLLAIGTAVVGGLWPAWSASRERVTDLLRG